MKDFGVRTLALAAVIASGPVPARQDAPFDRFFTSAATRAELDRARSRYDVESPPSGPAEIREPVEVEDVTVNGLIMRSDGTGQVWVNRSSETDRSGSVRSITLDSSDKSEPAVTLTLPGGNQVKLRPGEVFSLETGAVREAYQSTEKARPEPETPPEEAEAKPDDPDDEQVSNTESLPRFDESRLAERELRIQLLEERLEGLESQLDAGEKRTAPREGKVPD